MKRLVVLTSTALVFGFALLGGTAWASVSSLTLDSKAQLSATKTQATATGTVVCTAGDSVDITVVILQSSGQVDAASQGTATITCTGQVQAWAVTTDVVIGSSFKKGPATAIFAATDTTDNTFFPTQTQGLKLG
jgi:hypothetical protein